MVVSSVEVLVEVIEVAVIAILVLVPAVELVAVTVTIEETIRLIL